MVSFLVWRVPKVASQDVISAAISGQEGTIFGELPGDQVCVTRPSMEAMDEDLGDSDEDMPELIDSDDEDLDRYRHTFTPRVALGDVFEQLAEGTSCLGSCSREPFGWTAADKGGHGLCLADYFTGVTAGSKDSQPPSSSRPTVKLGDTEWASVQKLHPNNFFASSSSTLPGGGHTALAAAVPPKRRSPGVSSWQSL